MMEFASLIHKLDDSEGFGADIATRLEPHDVERESVRVSFDLWEGDQARSYIGGASDSSPCTCGTGQRACGSGRQSSSP